MPWFPLPPRLWALEFANPGLLAGMAAASIPIILHLLNRRKYRETRWAAMQFLLAAIRRNRRRIRVEQWLLLALRTLLIALVVAAMAKPFLESFGNVITGRRTHRVLVLDGSMSMGYTTGGGTRFEQAKRLASQLVKDSRQGDTISVITMGEPPRVVIGDPLPNLAEVQKEIGDLSQTHGATDLQATFEAIDRVLDVSTIPQKEILFLTDLQQASWNRPNAAGRDGLDRVVAKLEARRPRSIVIDLAGASRGENRAVTDLQVDTPAVTAGMTAPIRAFLRNFGPSPAQGIAVRLTVDGRLGPEQSVDLPVAEDVPVVFNHQFTVPGDHVVEVSIDADPLPLDDRRRLVVPVRESLNVLLVDGHFKSEPFEAETDYLAQALAPSEGSPGQPAMIRAEVVAESQFSRRELHRYDAVVLCNVAQVSQSEVSSLEDYLRQGGGLVIFGGDQVVTDNYNRLLFADGKGLLPASLGEAVGDAAKKQAAFGLNPMGYRHPLVSEFRGEPDPVTAGLTRALTWRYHKLIVPPGTPAKVAIAFDNGDPAVVETPRHRGRVILIATSADAGWTSWPLHNSYPPVMQQLILHAAAGRLAEYNIRVGQPFDRTFPATGAASPVSILTPKGQTVAARLSGDGGTSQLHFEQTDLSGTYQVRIGPPLAIETDFAANPDPLESDPAKLDQSGLERRLPGWNFTYLTNWRELTRSAVSVGRRGELQRPLLIGALCVLLLESFLAWRFGHHDPAT
ncbi:MAG: BatA domain-containing protein [Isosphaeraceae bacterium]